MIKIYNKELKYDYISNNIYETLRINKINLVKTDTILENDLSLYIIIGAEYLINVPKNYIIYQLQPTSHLTLSQKVEAYWFSIEYINILKNAKLILDNSPENIKVWENFYNFSNVLHFDISYTSSFLVDSNKQIYNKPQKIYLLNNRRSQKIYDKYNEKINIEIIEDNNYYNIINQIKKNNGIFVYILEYEKTMPLLSLIALFIYNNVPCVIEKGRDDYIINKLQNLNCNLSNYFILEKNLIKIINSIKPIKKIKRFENIDLSNKLTDYLLTFSKDTINSKYQKKKLDLYNRIAIKDIDFELLEDGGIKLKFEDINDLELPKISICTPTYNRRWIFPLAIRNFINFNYPNNKMEWIILDDGNDNLGEIIPRDKRVKYYHLEDKIPLSNKRNKLVELASNDIIIFMDDDDFYPPESILARVKSLLKYEKKGVKCVGCIDVANYDIKKQSCAIGSNGNSYFCESSLAFYKSFWIERPFKSDIHFSEYRHFLEYRQDQLRNIPFQFITISLYHGKNTTGEVRASLNNSIIDNKKILEIFGDDMDFLNFLNKIQNK